MRGKEFTTPIKRQADHAGLNHQCFPSPIEEGQRGERYWINASEWMDGWMDGWMGGWMG